MTDSATINPLEPHSLALLDPELRSLLDLVSGGDLDAETLAASRQAMREALLPASPQIESGQVRRAEHLIEGPPGSGPASPPVRVLVYTPREIFASEGVPAGARRAALLHIHGGGYVMGTPEINDARNAALVAELGCVLVSVDYRVAPEARFPAAIEDCYAALHWLHASASTLDVDPSRIVLIGESAGGGLAASLTLLARDRGVVKPRAQILIYPMLDDRTGSTAAVSPLAGAFIWTAASNRFGWSSLLGTAPGGLQTSPYAAAARAADLAGLPPAFIAVGALDLFIEENIDYAARLIAAGVATELHVYPGAVHAFDMMQDAGVSQNFSRDLIAALRGVMR